MNNENTLFGVSYTTCVEAVWASDCPVASFDFDDGDADELTVHDVCAEGFDTSTLDSDDAEAETSRVDMPDEPLSLKGRVREQDVPPIPEGVTVSVYQRLVDYGLLRKLTDIVMAKTAMPWHLRADATLEVHAAWAGLTAKPNFQRNQLARYADISGQHAALKLRRTIGAVVVIPGALFRTGRESAFMEAIGAAVNPHDVDDYRDSLELSTGPADDLHLSAVNETFFNERLSGLSLSAKQAQVAKMAILDRMAADDIATSLKMELMYVERLLNQVTQKLLSKDSGEDVKKAGRKPKNNV